MIDYTLKRLKEQYIRLYEVEKLKGGLADNKSLEDIANKHNVGVEDLKTQWNMGLDVEKEHTDDNIKADEIVKDHLWEDPKYYTKLKKMEKESIGRISESWDDDDTNGATDWDSLYMNHFGGIRESARKLGIDLDSARLINSKRPSMKDIKDVAVDPKYHQWYSIGTAWLDWIQGKMPHWLAPCTYAVILDENKIVNIDNLTMIDAFQRDGSIIKGKEDHPKDMAIDWARLYENNYGAVEFNPYMGHISGRQLKKGARVGAWYDSIDMSSGAIVNKSCIKKIIKLYDGTEDFRDMGIKI